MDTERRIDTYNEHEKTIQGNFLYYFICILLFSYGHVCSYVRGFTFYTEKLFQKYCGGSFCLCFRIKRQRSLSVEERKREIFNFTIDVWNTGNFM